MDATMTIAEVPPSCNHQTGKREIPPPGLTLNTVTPCAACKLLRRRCAEECPFSPYFSPHEPQKFAAVHKVFGASNVSKMLLEVPESQRPDAANSLVYEANVRLRDPVYGCMGAILALQQQLQRLQAELSAVRAEILQCKYREAANNTLIPPTTTHPTSGPPTPPAVAAAAIPPLQSSLSPQTHTRHLHPPHPSTPPALHLVTVKSSSPLPSNPSAIATFTSHSTDHRVPYFH